MNLVRSPSTSALLLYVITFTNMSAVAMTNVHGPENTFRPNKLPLPAKKIVAENPLAEAAKFGHLDVLEKLLQEGADVNPRKNDPKFATPLRHAARNGKTACAKRLVEAGASLHWFDRRGESDLIHAVRNGHIDTVRYLLEATGAPVNQQSTDGKSALHVAAENGNLTMVDLLIRHHANPNLLDSRNRTPFAAAIGRFHVSIAQHLLPLTKNPFRKDYNGRTLLSQALLKYFPIENVFENFVEGTTKIDNGWGETIHFLLNILKIDVNEPDLDGCTILHHLARRLHSPHDDALVHHVMAMIQGLMHAGGDVFRRNMCGETPHHIAHRHKDEDIKAFFEWALAGFVNMPESSSSFLHCRLKSAQPNSGICYCFPEHQQFTLGIARKISSQEIIKALGAHDLPFSVEPDISDDEKNQQEFSQQEDKEATGDSRVDSEDEW